MKLFTASITFPNVPKINEMSVDIYNSMEKRSVSREICGIIRAERKSRPFILDGDNNLLSRDLNNVAGIAFDNITIAERDTAVFARHIANYEAGCAPLSRFGTVSEVLRSAPQQHDAFVLDFTGSSVVKLADDIKAAICNAETGALLFVTVAARCNRNKMSADMEIALKGPTPQQMVERTVQYRLTQEAHAIFSETGRKVVPRRFATSDSNHVLVYTAPGRQTMAVAFFEIGDWLEEGEMEDEW